ncbi:MAG: hypothetical protein WDM76_19730 [Limisphaerales bacterium]
MQNAANLAAVKLKGWKDAERAAFQIARTGPAEQFRTQSIHRAKDTTTTKNTDIVSWGCKIKSCIKYWLGISTLLILAFAARADNYEINGRVAINGQIIPFYFRWDDGRWMICEAVDKLNSQYKKICLSCDGSNLITFYENKLDHKPSSLVPYQANVKSGAFPGQEANFFGAIAAALETSLLSADLNLKACQMLYPSANQDVCNRCVTNYSITLTSPSPFKKILSIITDKIAVEGTTLTNGWEILHAEIIYDTLKPKLVKQFTIKYQNPDFNRSDQNSVQVVYNISGNISEYKTLTTYFDGWPPIEGKTAVSDSRLINETNPFAMTYLTARTWVTNVDGLQMSIVQSNFLATVHAYNSRLNTGRWVLVILCVNITFLTILLARWLAKKRTEIKQ